jgi:hypothetical protein
VAKALVGSAADDDNDHGEELPEGLSQNVESVARAIQALNIDFSQFIKTSAMTKISRGMEALGLPRESYGLIWTDSAAGPNSSRHSRLSMRRPDHLSSV